jgi:hypothetical protein
MRDWDEPLSVEQRDELIDKIASAVVARRMETPAILFLEMHKPLSFIASQGLVVSSPFVAPLVGIDNVQLAVKLLEDRENVERVIRRIEEKALEHGRRKPAHTSS